MGKWSYVWSGTYFYPFGNTYIGEWKNGKKEGKYIHIYFEGNMLELKLMIKNMVQVFQ